MKKTMKKLLSGIVTLFLIVTSVISGSNLSVRAAAVSPATQFSISVAADSTPPDNYSVSWSVVKDDAGHTAVDGFDGNTNLSTASAIEFTNMDDADLIKIQVQNAGKGIRLNGADVTSEGWAEGKYISVSQLESEYSFELFDLPAGGGDPGGQGGGGQGGGANLRISYDDTSLTYGEIQWIANAGDNWTTQSSNTEETVYAVRVVYNNEGKLADQVAFRVNGNDTLAANKSALESVDGFVIPNGEVYDFEHVQFVSSSGGGQGGQGGGQGGGASTSTSFSWNTLDQSDSHVTAVKYKIGGAADWTTFDRATGLSLAEGDTITVKIDLEDGFFIEDFSARYVNKSDENIRYYYRYSGDTTTVPIGLEYELASDTGYTFTFSPETASADAGGVAGLDDADAYLRFQFRVSESFSDVAQVFVYMQVLNEDTPSKGYGVNYEESRDVFTFVDNVGIEEVIFNFNGNQYGGQGAPLSLGYGYANDGSCIDGAGDPINDGNPIFIEYPTGYAGSGGQVTQEVLSFGYFEVGAKAVGGSDPNVFEIEDDLIDEIYVIEDSSVFTSSNKISPVNGKYTVNLDQTKTNYSILIRRHEPTTRNIQWMYTLETGKEDAYVDHGKVFVEKIERSGVTILGNISKDSDGNVILTASGEPTYGIDTLNTEGVEGRGTTNSAGGDYFLQKGDVITIMLIPTYGYQIKSAQVNGMSLTPNATVSSFTFTMGGNIHLAGTFTQSNDKTNVSGAEGVTAASISNGQNAADSGNLSLSVVDHGGTYAKEDDAIEAVLTGTTDTTAETLQTLDMSLDNIVSKGSANSYWTSNITEFNEDITVSLKLSGVSLASGESIAVVREHGGNLEVIDVTYNSATGTLSVPTNKFSTYSVIKKKGPAVAPSGGSQQSSGGGSSSSETTDTTTETTSTDTKTTTETKTTETKVADTKTATGTKAAKTTETKTDTAKATTETSTKTETSANKESSGEQKTIANEPVKEEVKLDTSSEKAWDAVAEAVDEAFAESLASAGLSEEEIAVIMEAGDLGKDILETPIEVVVKMGENTELDSSILEKIQGKNVDLVLDLGNGIKWTINGNDVTGSELANINVEVSLGETTIPENEIDTLADGNPSINLSLTHDGEFGFAATLTVEVGGEYAGQYANLYYYNPNGGYEFMGSYPVKEDGSSDLAFTHASEYTLIFTELPMDKTLTQVGATTNPVTTTTESGGEVVLDNHSPAKIIILIVCIAAIAGFIGFLIVKKNKSQEE